MTREEMKYFLPIVHAWAEGKTIQYNFDDVWRDVDIDLNLTHDDISKYRIKAEPKYKPFKSKEECWEEMQKHQPFGWIKSPNGKLFCIDTITDVGITNIHRTCQFSDYLETNYTFADGTPFGVKEE